MNFAAQHVEPPLANTVLERVPAPSWEALRTLFVVSAIPMVGFGFMDNLVMIQAGQYIDSTLGVTLGLATMSAAAAGQVVSDVSGVVFGGTLERFLTRLSLIKAPALSQAQRQLSICRNVSMAGAVVGVVIGCALGATTLLLVDLEARDRIDRATQLREIITDMITDTHRKAGVSVGAAGAAVAASAAGCLSSETATVYFSSGKDFHMDTPEEQHRWRTSLVLLQQAESAAVKECAAKREVVVDTSGQILCSPIVIGEELVAVIEFRCNRQQETKAGFSPEDVLTAQVMARHVAIFMNRIRS